MDAVWNAIRALSIRGAPAIGVAGAYGVVLGVQATRDRPVAAFLDHLHKVADRFRACRPTAVNLPASADRMEAVARGSGADSAEILLSLLLLEARKIHEEEQAACKAMARHGAKLIENGHGVLTHCNTGGLATAGKGTALGVVIEAHEQGKRIHVYADETRPLLQGARLTVLELMRAGVDVTLICDSAAARVMHEGRVNAVLVGADRIAANGDTANKIGTQGLALAAHAHDIPFYVVAPTSTIDPDLESGQGIPIEVRAPEEVTVLPGTGSGKNGIRTAPEGAQVYNPAFDVTPWRYIRAIVTEKGVLQPPFEDSICGVMRARHEEAT
jgi:methylthioribose-1-phosphate isomerase